MMKKVLIGIVALVALQGGAAGAVEGVKKGLKGILP